MKLQCCINKNELKESSAVMNRSRLKIRKESQTTLFWDTVCIIFKLHWIRPFKNTLWNIYSISENRHSSWTKPLHKATVVVKTLYVHKRLLLVYEKLGTQAHSCCSAWMSHSLISHTQTTARQNEEQNRQKMRLPVQVPALPFPVLVLHSCALTSYWPVCCRSPYSPEVLLVNQVLCPQQ